MGARRVLRWGRKILAGAIILVTTGLACGVFLLGTTTGARFVLARVLGALPVQVRLEGVSGRLWGAFELQGASIHLPGLEASVERVAVRWRPWALAHREVAVERLELSGVDVRLVQAPAGEEKPPAEGRAGSRASATASPLARLPVRVTFESVLVRDLDALLPDSAAVEDTRLDLSGSLSDYTVSVAGTADLPHVGPVAVSLRGTGTTDRIELAELRADLLGGQFEGSGSVAWWPRPEWRLDFSARELRPAAAASTPADWPGTVSGRGSIAGSLGGGPTATAVGAAAGEAASSLQLQVRLDTIWGELRGQPVAGRIEAALGNGALQLPEARLSWGPASVRAAGAYQADLDMEFEASVPDLELVLPGATGTLAVRGRLSGSPAEPRIVASVRADSVAHDGASAALAEGSLNLDLRSGGRLSADLSGRNLAAGGAVVDSARVRLRGKRAGHDILLEAEGPRGRLRLEAEGSLPRPGIWRGTVQSLEASAEPIGAWELEEAFALSLSADSVRVGTACLVSPPARVCTGGERSARGIAWLADVAGLDLARARPFLPEGMHVDAELEARAEVTWPPGGPIEGSLDLRTGAGAVLLSGGEATRRLAFAPISVRAAADAESLVASADVALADSVGSPVLSLNGELTVPGPIRRTADLLERSASGRAQVRIADLAPWISAVAPQLSGSGAAIATAEFEVGEDRVVTGRLDVDAGPAELGRTKAGRQRRLLLEPFHLSLQADPGGMKGELDIAVATAEGTPVVLVTGSASLPGPVRAGEDLAARPLEGRMTARLSDLSLLELLIEDVSEAEGTLELEAAVEGSLAAARVTGEGRLRHGRAVLPDLGLELTGLEVLARGDPDGTVTIEGEVRSGPGRIILEGRSVAGERSETRTTLSLRGERFQLVNTPEIQLLSNPDLELVFDGSTIRLSGEVAIPSGRFEFREVPASAVAPSRDVVIVGDTLVETASPVPLSADVRILLGNDVFFRGLGFSARLEGDLRVSEEPGTAPVARGELRFADGTYRALGQELRVDPGRLIFSGPLDDPRLDVRAYVRASDGTEAGLRLGGSAQSLQAETYSRPQKSDSETMSYILFGRPLNQTTGAQGQEASNAAAVLGANVLAMSLAPSVGLDEARIETGSSQSRNQLVMGKYLSPRLYLGYGVGLYEPISTVRIRYLLSSKWSIEAITGDERATDLLYRVERGGVK